MRRLATEVRVKNLQSRFASVLDVSVSLTVCRQLVREEGARRIDSLLKGDDDGTYEDLKDLSERY